MNIVKEILELKKKVNKIYCSLGGVGGSSFMEIDPTVPTHVKDITEQDIINWNTTTDEEVQITVGTQYAQVAENQAVFNKNISDTVDSIQDNFLNLQIEFDLTEKQ